MVAYAKKAAQHNLNIMLYQGCHTEYKSGAKCFALYPFQSDVKLFASLCPLLEVEDATLNTIKFTATVEDAFAEPGDEALPVPQDKWIHIIAYANSGWQHMHLKPGNVADALRAQGFVVMRSNRHGVTGELQVFRCKEEAEHTSGFLLRKDLRTHYVGSYPHALDYWTRACTCA